MAKFKLQARWSPLYLVVLIVLAWIAYITVTILRTPADGAPTPEQLAQNVTQSIQANDVDRLSRLIEYPRQERHEFAAEYIEQLNGAPPPPTVSYQGGDQVEFSTPQYRYTLRITQTEQGQWVLTFLPPLD